jgi:DnaJ-class molecular chaperone
MSDPYQVLGLRREATADEIQKAYRRLAKKNHPDLHPGDKAAEARFKDVATAYGVVGDEEKRRLFDSGKLDATGVEVPPAPEAARYRSRAEAPSSSKYSQGWDGAGSGEDDLFAELFGRRSPMSMRGSDVTYTLAIEFLEAVNGAKKRVVMADGKTLDIAIPACLDDGQTLRLRGQGQPGHGGAAAGDVLVVIHIIPHPVFQRDGIVIRSKLSVTLAEAFGGAKITADTVTGPVTLTVPKGANTGTVLRLRGKGVPSKTGAGDHMIELQVMLPTEPDDTFVQSVVAWETAHPYDPRKTKVGQS